MSNSLKPTVKIIECSERGWMHHSYVTYTDHSVNDTFSLMVFYDGVYGVFTMCVKCLRCKWLCDEQDC